MRSVGIIGYPVEHSLSPAMHNAAFAALGLDYCYVLLPTPPDRFEARIHECMAQDFAGWNVTVPHKQAMLPFLDTMSDDVRATGACNTVLVEDGRLAGFNTDIAGFLRGLEDAGGAAPGSKAVLLGAGGAARAVAYALSRAGHPVTILSRRPEQAARLAESLSCHDHRIASGLLEQAALEANLAESALLVNCTPAGMWPDIDISPLPDGARLRPGLLVYDLVYKPRPTRLLQEAVAASCRTQDGLAMLVSQGAEAFKIWTGQQPPLDVMRDACETTGEGRPKDD
jgi:shikimate dehydrogenase